ncbi:hypothetical protein BAE44_0016896 [Dichanthelium oligosanthes]|uniref:Uncharacterized protein n=1 Tax=Dichanthelium oligosanthes TaxID=888268 RepID=A0A1E5VAN6_9POAL|nr:hypothetical protein BAE44_0016896 [Dichanthelium oligosanthes]
MHTARNTWKERNRRTFEGNSQRPDQVFILIQEEVNLRRWACGSPDLC